MQRNRFSDRRRVLTGMAAMGLTTACSGPAPYLVGMENADRPIDSVPGTKRHRIMIATTREAAPDIPGAFYGNRRSEDLNFASVEVSVPPTHEIGVVERPQQLPPDPERHFVITNPKVARTKREFAAAIDAELRARPRADRNAMIFLHGYNNSLSSAVLHLAQFVEDTGYTGVPILFSFASAGRGYDYLYDVNSAIIARDAFLELRTLGDIPSLEGFEIFAHSMGNIVLMEALRQQALTGTPVRSPKLRGIVMASPDIDFDLFKTQLAAIPVEDRAFVVLTSKDDRALTLSQRLAGGQVRVGRADPEELAALGVAVIDLSEVSNVTSSHHSKFSESDEFVKLVGDRLLAGDQFGRADTLTPGQVISLGVDGTIEVLGDALGG
ncbi:MAG: alpha/beta hydrolase [Rhodobacteraceae bacterium]|nr:alpha/beta hydrolase [Paracoccaceae bacterium]